MSKSNKRENRSNSIKSLLFRKKSFCPHCKLIDSGDVACYQLTCPECGEIPPSRNHLYPGHTSTDVQNQFINASLLLYFTNLSDID